MTFSLISELIRQFIRVYDLELSGGDHDDTHLLPERLATCRQVHPDETSDIGTCRTKHVCADVVTNQGVRQLVSDSYQDDTYMFNTLVLAAFSRRYTSKISCVIQLLVSRPIRFPVGRSH